MLDMLSEEIGMFEAKTNFSKIVERAENGHDVVITRRGKPVVKISSLPKEPEMTFEEAVEKLIGMRKLYRGKPGSFDIRAAIEEGRR